MTEKIRRDGKELRQFFDLGFAGVAFAADDF
jgi:hypothetical protein